MRKGILGSLAVLLASTGLAVAQPALPSPVATPPVAAAAEGEAHPVASDSAGPAQQDGPFPGYPACPPFEPVAPPPAPAEDPQWNSGSDSDKCMPYCWYISGEYLHWWLHNQPMPPLVTTGPADTRGTIGANGTQVLIGESNFSNMEENGFRLTLGLWLDRDTSLEAAYFFINEGSGLAVNQNTNPILSRPFLNVVTGAEDIAGVALPGLVNGGVQVLQDSQLWGGEVNVRRKHLCGKHFNLDILLGLRYIELDESLVVNENLAILPEVPVIGGLNANAQDQFATRNRFYGGQAGVEAEWDFGPFFVNARAKIALGAAVEEVAIRGQTQRTDITGTSSVQGGLLALPTNIGSHSQTRFSVAPEAGFNVGCMFTEHMRASIGYNFLLISDVLRPGNQIDRGINPAQSIPGSFGGGGPAVPARPAFAFKESDFYVHGLSVSVEFRF